MEAHSGAQILGPIRFYPLKVYYSCFNSHLDIEIDNKFKGFRVAKNGSKFNTYLGR